MPMEDPLSGCTGFDWDEGNADKSWERHRVSQSECEEALFLQPLVVAADRRHSKVESRFFALGQTTIGRLLFIVFTIRGERVRVISARPMSRRERRAYERAQEEPDTTPEP